MLYANWFFAASFSGKLSPVMPNSSEPAEGDRAAAAPDAGAKPQEARPREVGGREGPDPTRFGDWELRGRCVDF